jgi:nucleotide-binding universal stress UspA family protein
VFRSILVAIDGSRTAMKALEEAIDLARSDGARLTLISVAAPLRWRYTGPVYVPYPTEHDLERAAWDVVERAEALVPADVSVSTVVRAGDPATAIVARAEEGEHDLVVVGSRGLGPLGSLVLGSVSRAVIARSHVPVLVAGRGRAEEPALALEPRGEVRVERAHVGATMHAEPSTRGGPTIFLWLVAALLFELQLFVWIFDRMTAP